MTGISLERKNSEDKYASFVLPESMWTENDKDLDTHEE